MDKKLFNAVVYAVLGALTAAKDGGTMGGIPNGHMYTMLMGELSLEQWTKTLNLLLDAELVTQANYLVKVTPKGEKLFRKLDAVLDEAKKGVE